MTALGVPAGSLAERLVMRLRAIAVVGRAAVPPNLPGPPGDLSG